MKLELIEHKWLVLRRSAVTWVTLLVNAIVAAVGVHWAALLGVLPFLPPWVRWPLAALVGALVTVPTIIARLTAQPKMRAEIAEKNDA